MAAIAFNKFNLGCTHKLFMNSCFSEWKWAGKTKEIIVPKAIQDTFFTMSMLLTEEEPFSLFFSKYFLFSGPWTGCILMIPR